ncbi:MAG TPA: dethiobiotin synthase [Acidimicrobiales bacterium]|nr:dethiobiotin synthase [Acidimicrobiales bacterium]
MRGLFVTGTDTEVGKTFVASALVRALLRRGVDVGVAKPFQSGALATDPAGDAAALARAAGVADPLEAIAPNAFRAPLAPLVAARLEGREADLDATLGALEALAARHDALVVEGAGGLLVPVAPGATIADLAAACGLPLVVVARAGLGTVNHVALTCALAAARGLRVAGVVLNGAADASSAGNPGLIEELAAVRVLGHLPPLVGPASPDALADHLERHVDLAPLLAAVAPARKEELRA